ncbi:MAG TPA: ATP-grasp fold amidoligase family protein [Ureibacillus sp.]|nr:ATP-grasp fold amidoligase family protein [Ureibacillus sp.]
MLLMDRALGKIFSLIKRISPVMASKIIYYKTFKKKLNLKNPTTFNEKLMWLKLNEDDTFKAKCTDKYLVRDYIKELGYSNILIELYNVYEHAEDIDFDALPDRFAMKCTHGSGFNIICNDKNTLDLNLVRLQLNKWMNTNYSFVNGEPHYSKIKPRIIVERFLERSNLQAPIDYKIHCFHGKPQIIEVALPTMDLLYNCDWELLPYNMASVNYNETLERPERLEEMLEIARGLSRAFLYVRVDLYYCNNEIYFGELTFTPAACLDVDFIDDADYQMGKLLHLEVLNNKSL